MLQVRHGGMGEVYICEPVRREDRPDGLDVRFALKTYPRRMLLNADARRAFIREVATWARLTLLPGVVPVFGLEHIDGRTFALTVAVEPDENGDVSVQDLMMRGPLPASRVLDIAWQAAATLANLGRSAPGLVHGDLKPGNVLLWGGVGVMIADFGLSRGVAKATGDTRLMATRDYLAPEACGAGYTSTVAGDVYAFGVTLREMLDSGDGADTVLHGALGRLARSCTAEDPASRPSSFDAVAGQLSAIASATGTEVMIGDKFIQATADHTVAVSARRSALPVTVQVLLGVGMTDIALELLDSLPRNEWDAMIWTAHGSAISVTGDDISAVASFEQAWARLEDNPADRDLIDLANEHALSLIELLRCDEAISLLERAITVASGAALKRTKANLAGAFIKSGRHQAAIDLLERLIEQDGGGDDARVWNQLGFAYQAAGQPASAVTALRRAVRLAPGDSRVQLALARALLQYQEDVDSAVPSLDLAITLAPSFSAEAIVLRLVCALVQGDKAKQLELLALTESQLGLEEAKNLMIQAVGCLQAIPPQDRGAAS